MKEDTQEESKWWEKKEKKDKDVKTSNRGRRRKYERNARRKIGKRWEDKGRNAGKRKMMGKKEKENEKIKIKRQDQIIEKEGEER